MKIIFIGSGSAFTVGANNYHSNMLIENDQGERLLLDCGSDARLALYEVGVSHKDIHSVYISHLHADHVGGLEWLGFTTKFDPQGKKPHLYVSEKLLPDLWNKVLSGGLSSLQIEEATLSSFFHVHTVKDNNTFVWKKIKFQLVQTIHVISGFTLNPSFGVMFTANGLTVFFTSDTQFCPNQLRDFYGMADIIFHDCETTSVKSTVHAHYDELVTLPEEIKKKMWLYHYNPGPLPNAVADGFLGFVKKGQCFDFNSSTTLFGTSESDTTKEDNTLIEILSTRSPDKNT